MIDRCPIFRTFWSINSGSMQNETLTAASTVVFQWTGCRAIADGCPATGVCDASHVGLFTASVGAGRVDSVFTMLVVWTGRVTAYFVWG